MFDQGPHVVLRRDGVCLILKAPDGDMPQVEYWGRDFLAGAVGATHAADLADLAHVDGVNGAGAALDESALAALDAMTLKDTPPNKPDAAWRPSLLPQGAEGWAGRAGLECARGGRPVYARWTGTSVSAAADGHALSITAEDAVNAIRLESTIALQPGGLVVIRHTVTDTADGSTANGGEPLSVSWLDATLPCPKRVDTLTVHRPLAARKAAGHRPAAGRIGHPRLPPRQDRARIPVDVHRIHRRTAIRQR